MHLDIGTNKAPGAMIIASLSPDRASVFSMCFLKKVPDYDLPMDLGNGIDEMDMIGIGRIFGVAPCRPHTAFDMFGVSILKTDGDDSILDAYIDDMDFIGIGRILDADPRRPHSAFDISGVFVLDDGSVLDVSLLLILLLLRRCPTLWTHLFLLTLCLGLSPALMIFSMVIMT